MRNTAWGTCYGRGGPNTATMDSPGGPLMAGDYPWHDRQTIDRNKHSSETAIEEELDRPYLVT